MGEPSFFRDDADRSTVVFVLSSDMRFFRARIWSFSVSASLLILMN